MITIKIFYNGKIININIKCLLEKKEKEKSFRHFNFTIINEMFLRYKKQKKYLIYTAKMSKYETNIFHKRRPRGMQVSGSHQRNAS